MPDLEGLGHRVFSLSTATHDGLRPLLHALADLVAATRAAQAPAEATRIVLHPPAVGRASSFTVAADGGGFTVTGDKPRRWVMQTDFTNAEAVGYLADRLAKLGVEEELARLGAEPGAVVTIGDVSFEWEPATPAGELAELAEEVTLGPRGSDSRLHGSRRLTRSARNARHAAATGWDPDDAEGDANGEPS
jgi:GTP-binding protein